MFLGMSIFLIFPFTRLVHVWSGFATVGYVLRPYQVVRSRRALAPRKPASAAAPSAAPHAPPKAVPSGAAARSTGVAR